MDIKDLDKKQLILLTFLITFVVSIATGIVTVSLMSQMPKNVPQTINNVIQRTIEKVTTVETPTNKNTTIPVDSKKSDLVQSGEDALVSIYSLNEVKVPENTDQIISSQNVTNPTGTPELKELGQGVIISDIGLILVDSSILGESQTYKVILNKVDFNADVLKKFNNGFSILKISEKKSVVTTPENTKDTNIIVN
jgi:hypothetical protein